MFAILLFSYKFIRSHIVLFIYCSYWISNISFRKKTCQDSTNYVAATNQLQSSVSYRNIVISIHERVTFHLMWRMFSACKSPGQLLYVWWLSDQRQSDSVPWCFGHLDTSLFATAGHRNGASWSCPDVTHISANHPPLGGMLCCLTQGMWNVYFHWYTVRINKKQIILERFPGHREKWVVFVGNLKHDFKKDKFAIPLEVTHRRWFIFYFIEINNI